uniref:Ovule protein n=1 Tax=Schistosoma mansoni TaxID=6183 RepID=A0A5K4F927_SCHMA
MNMSSTHSSISSSSLSSYLSNENHQCRQHPDHLRNLDDNQLTYIHCGDHVLYFSNLSNQ